MIPRQSPRHNHSSAKMREMALTYGFFLTNQIYHHPMPDHVSGVLDCGICSKPTWTNHAFDFFRVVNDEVIIACCVCAIPLLRNFDRPAGYDISSLMQAGVVDLSRFNSDP